MVVVWCGADSKVLTEGQREEMFGDINTTETCSIGWKVTVLTPQYISGEMLGRFVRPIYTWYSLPLRCTVLIPFPSTPPSSPSSLLLLLHPPKHTVLYSAVRI
jgi:hypothetical protein